MPRDREVERELRIKGAEEIVVEYIDGVFVPPAHVRPLVEKYNQLRRVVDTCDSYPRVIDEQMNKLYDAMVVMVS